jgi:YYY domain-containing protein
VIGDAFLWWLTAQFLGLLFLPLSFRLFSSLPDRGYNFSKALAILLVSFTLWSGGLARLLPNSATSISVLLLLMAFLSGYLVVRHGREMLAVLKEERWAILASEVLFAAVFSFWALVRAYDPAINHTEKPMDFALMNGILQSEHFPPNDPWLSGHSISYYYFGYLQASTLTKLTGLSPNVTYNLSLVLVAAMAFQGAFGLVYNLVRLAKGQHGAAGTGLILAVAFGLVAGVFVGLIGNLEGVLEFARANGWGTSGLYDWVAVRGLEQPQASSAWYPTDTWWWWRASRLLSMPHGAAYQETITEFPFFSFLLGDLHPHVMALPFGLLVLGASLAMFTRQETYSLAWAVRNPGFVLVLTIAVGALGFLNSWDLPTYGLIFLLALLAQSYLRSDKRLLPALRTVGPLLVLFGAAFLLLYLPFYLRLQTQAQGILPVEEVTTRPQHFFLFWGPFFVLTMAMSSVLAWKLVRARPQPLGSLAREGLLFVGLALLPFLFWAPARVGVGLHGGQDLGGLLLEVGEKFGRLLPAHAVLALSLFSAVRMVRQEGEGKLAVVFVALMTAVGYLLILGPEYFFINDLFHTRMNTVFKFYYQGWVLLATSSAFSIYYLHLLRPGTGTWRIAATYSFWVVIGLLVFGSLLYPMAATYNKSNNFSGRPTLDGLAFLKDSDAAEYEAIEWMRENREKLGPSPVVLEAFDEADYWVRTRSARISMATGFPTLIGWLGHEHQWRGSLEPVGDRPQVVREIYTTTDANRALELLTFYGVTHVYVGALERQMYGTDGLGKFEQVMEKIYDTNSGVLIYQMRGS